ncbi:ANTAR domain-containing protein [Streptomyces kunmingensis]|uniref:ANTAR domain-containing protein n=1 Tax=Streptomyces kunmingensis TaxID=68225 RepID=A0ABU6C2Y6_9ACTN|nr:ANTAR domain-containing protein [Streptomyces kunmingensis]MEB3958879.1 ANTAR domain-containing protein [Streptomyces kunmingensis]
MSREEHLARTFVELADTLVEDFDLIEFLQQMTVRCSELLDITDAVVYLAHPAPRLYSPAPCNPQPALQRVIDAACLEGPAVEAYRTTHAAIPDYPVPGEPAPAWPRLHTALEQAGYALPSAVPLRLRGDSLGALLLLHTGDRALSPDDLLLAQALADAATIGLLHARTLGRQETVNGQLHSALHGRIVIEQAKGIVAVRRRVSLNDAYAAIRAHAHNHQEHIGRIAMAVIDTGLLPAMPAARPHQDPKNKG